MLRIFFKKVGYSLLLTVLLSLLIPVFWVPVSDSGICSFCPKGALNTFDTLDYCACYPSETLVYGFTTAVGVLHSWQTFSVPRVTFPALVLSTYLVLFCISLCIVLFFGVVFREK
jgi:hypothetical protein